jgi:hypothetical protein
LRLRHLPLQRATPTRECVEVERALLSHRSTSRGSN